MSNASADPGGFARLLPDVVRERYALKLTAAFLLVIVAIAAIGGVTYLRTGDQVTERTEERLRTQAQLQSGTVDQWFEQMRGETVLLAQSEAIRGGGNAIRVQQFLTSKQGSLPSEVAALHYYDASSGAVLATTGEGMADANAREKGLPWAGEDVLLRNGVATVFGPYETADGTRALALATAVPASSSKGVVLVIDLAERSAKLSTAGDAETVVVNERGTVVLASNPERIGTQNMGPAGETGVESAAVKSALDGKSGYTEMEMHGETTTMGYAAMESADWAVMSHEPARSAFALRRQVTRGLGAILVAAILGLGLIGATIGRNTVNSLDALAAKAADLESGDLDTELRSDRADEIGDLFRGFASMRDALRERIEEADAARERAEAARRESEELVEHLEAKADAYSDAMAATAAGDLTRRVDPESRSEAMAEIGEAFNAMAEELEGSVARIQSFADDVAAASDRMAADAAEIRDSSEQVSESIQEISAGASRQSSDLEEITGEMSDLSAAIEEVASSAEEVATRTAAAVERGHEGSAAATEALEEMDRIEDATADAVEQVEALDDEIEEIGEIVGLITDIAEQTNMLALNASIEAARAGEAGEGFAVVADEIKGLAEETEEATAEIEELVAGIQSSTATTAEGMRETGQRVSEGRETVDRALDALRDIVERVEDANAGIQEIDDATDDQATSTQEAVAMIEEAASVSQQTTAEAENVSAAAEQQAASATEVSENVDRLSGNADELRDLLAGFDVGADGPAAGAAPADARPAASADGGAPVDGGDEPPEPAGE